MHRAREPSEPGYLGDLGSDLGRQSSAYRTVRVHTRLTSSTLLAACLMAEGLMADVVILIHAYVTFACAKCAWA